MSGTAPPPAVWPAPPPAGWGPPMVRPAATPPSCFSQLYALNQCYDDIIMMEQILSKVITNLFQTDPALVTAVVNAIAASGSNVPLIGVTNGSNAQPGQVGEFISFTQNVSLTGAVGQSQVMSVGTLPPGDWDVWAWMGFSVFITDGQFTMTPVPAGFQQELTAIAASSGELAISIPAAAVRASLTVPTPLIFTGVWNTLGPGGTGGICAFYVNARRMR